MDARSDRRGRYQRRETGRTHPGAGDAVAAFCQADAVGRAGHCAVSEEPAGGLASGARPLRAEPSADCVRDVAATRRRLLPAHACGADSVGGTEIINLQEPTTTAYMMRPGHKVKSPAITSAPTKRPIIARR